MVRTNPQVALNIGWDHSQMSVFICSARPGLYEGDSSMSPATRLLQGNIFHVKAILLLQTDCGSLLLSLIALWQFLLHKLNSCRGNYRRGETIQGRRLFAEIRYVFLKGFFAEN